MVVTVATVNKGSWCHAPGHGHCSLGPGYAPVLTGGRQAELSRDFVDGLRAVVGTRAPPAGRHQTEEEARKITGHGKAMRIRGKTKKIRK